RGLVRRRVAVLDRHRRVMRRLELADTAEDGTDRSDRTVRCDTERGAGDHAPGARVAGTGGGGLGRGDLARARPSFRGGQVLAQFLGGAQRQRDGVRAKRPDDTGGPPDARPAEQVLVERLELPRTQLGDDTAVQLLPCPAYGVAL